MKSSRLETIKSIIASETVQNQDELSKLLQERGFDVTQATLSRDLRELGIVKSHDPERGVYRYREGRPLKIASSPHRRFTVETIRSVEFSGNQGVVKTVPGFAAAVASIIDNNVSAGIMGTIAGDDVVLLILRAGYPVSALARDISRFIPGFADKMIDNS